MFTLALDRYDRYVSHILFNMLLLVLDVFKVFLTCILSKNIVLTIMDFKNF